MAKRLSMHKSDWEKRFYNQFGSEGLYGHGDLGTTPDRMQEVLTFIRSERRKAAQEAVAEERKRHLARLERLKLETDVIVCDCGDEWKDSDLANEIDEQIAELIDPK